MRLGLEQAGHKCAGFCELDKHAQTAYHAIHNTKGEWFEEDITKINPRELPEADIFVGGFPCQAFSMAGKLKGFNDPRGTLFFEFARLVEARHPPYILLENVNGLLHKPNRKNYQAILTRLDELGYDAEWCVLNTKDFGLPQSRKRVFIIGHSRRYCTRKVFPVTGENGKALKQIIPGAQGSRVYDIKGASCTLTSSSGGGGAKTGLYLVDEPIPCFYPEKEKVWDNHKRFKKPAEPMYTLTTADRHGVVVNTVRAGGRGSTDKKHRWDLVTNGKRIRRLTPRECWRLQGMPDVAFDKAVEAGVSETQLYRLAGNGVSVPVVFSIGEKLEIIKE